MKRESLTAVERERERERDTSRRQRDNIVQQSDTHTHTCSASGYLACKKNEYKYVSRTQEEYICGYRYVSAVSF